MAACLKGISKCFGFFSRSSTVPDQAQYKKVTEQTPVETASNNDNWDEEWGDDLRIRVDKSQSASAPPAASPPIKKSDLPPPPRPTNFSSHTRPSRPASFGMEDRPKIDTFSSGSSPSLPSPPSTSFHTAPSLSSVSTHVSIQQNSISQPMAPIHPVPSPTSAPPPTTVAAPPPATVVAPEPEPEPEIDYFEQLNLKPVAINTRKTVVPVAPKPVSYVHVPYQATQPASSGKLALDNLNLEDNDVSVDNSWGDVDIEVDSPEPSAGAAKKAPSRPRPAGQRPKGQRPDSKPKKPSLVAVQLDAEDP
eukprot:TRINITY_DN1161_c0_g1_i1.p1 TRINITY_DN1161_c0_g1~~TRINITY_DN1161_c0_g1_i1.p1  ORF type:complete len:306 (-),score=51.39 TRINITY_DN1161_c0_g1_i1:104-1021(-)